MVHARLRIVTPAVLLHAALIAVCGGAAWAQTAYAAAPEWRITSVSMPTNLPSAQRSEIQQVAVYAESGTFTLTFEGQTTAPIPFNASAASVQTALDSLSSISAGGTGKVLVTGGPGSSSGATPYRVTFAGSFQFKNVPQMTVDDAGLKGGPESASVATLVRGGEGHGVVRIVAVNTGDVATSGGVSIVDKLSAGITPVAIEGLASFSQAGKLPALSCTLATLTCTYAGEVLPGESLAVEVQVNVPPKAPQEVLSQASVSGGGASEASVSQAAAVSETHASAGIAPGSYFSALSSAEAGGHPNLTTAFEVTTEPNPEGTPVAVGSLHDVTVALPPGMISDANPASAPRCSQSDFYAGKCPSDTLVGTSTVLLTLGNPGKPKMGSVPVYNLVPEDGRVVDFGFNATTNVWVHVFAHLRSGGDYGADATVEGVSDGANILASTVTIWGVPGELNGAGPFEVVVPEGHIIVPFGGESTAVARTPLLTAPTSCEGQLATRLEVDFWQQIGVMHGEGSTLPAMSGCDALDFSPELALDPAVGVKADSPTGVTVHLKVPQQADENPEGVAEATVKNTVVTLPAGLQVNPAAAGGLVGCSPSDIGFRELEAGTGRPLFNEETEAQRLGVEAPPECPEDSAIGRVKVTTPLLAQPLEGAVYQAEQGNNPFKSLLALYIVAQNRQAGVRVRLAGEVKVAANGQLTATFDQTPQLPFEEFKLEFFGGGKAALATTGCGAYQTTSSIEPWSGEPAARPESEFGVSSGPGGAPCPSLHGFSPAFVAGTTNDAGGQFSPFTLQLARNDTEQTLSTVSATMPPGLAAMISNVQECPEAQANAGNCPAASKIGHVQVSAGVGSEPVVLPQAGKPEDPIYLTGPYQGAPFGVSIVAHAEAGPFNLGTVVVRGKIDVDPHTARVTIESEPMPTRLQGIPLDVRSVLATVDRPSFTFNPTNCESLSLTGAIGSSEGATYKVSTHFEAADCASLPFKPGFFVTTHARHTRRNGAYLHVRVTSGTGQANIKSVFVELPTVLPSRVSTLKLACTQAQFAKNPAGCPEGSFVGTAIAHTPVLPVPLTGPAIFVSHGGAAFPDLDVVLQGDNVTVDLTGSTNIVKDVTSSDFKSVPDVPVSSFELTLPEGPHSALAANANLCTKTVSTRVKTKVHGHTVRRELKTTVKRTLAMPTTITGQNGTVIRQSTKISVAGCAAPKPKKGKGRHHA